MLSVKQKDGRVVEVRNVTARESIPDSDHVLIEPVPGGKYRAIGSSAHRGGATVYRPSVFQTLEQAIRESVDWAGQSEVPVVYVREAPDAPRS
jgi:hypothetical protein